MLEFILGRPKSGKTTEIINRIKQCVKENKRTFLLVPEQQVHISETMLASMLPESWKCFEVITFSRLCELVFSKYGGLTKKSVDDNVKHLLIWHSANTLSDSLSEYGKIKNDTAFSDMMLSAITELSAYGISPEALAKTAEESDNPEFERKFLDIAAIYAEFKRNLSVKLGKNIVLKEEMQRTLADTLKEQNFFEGTCVFIDSFTDFTSSEEIILKRIIKSAEKTTIAINLPHRGYNQIHTESIRDTLKELTSFARDNYIPTSDFIVEANTNATSSALAEIEKNLWNFSLKPENRIELSDKQASAVNMTLCKNAYDEAEYVAIKLLEEKLNGNSFSDMAVIMRDAESYKGVIDTVFQKYNIPYFYSEKTDICNTSAARYILSSLRAISSNFRLDDILTLVKTGLCPVSDEECDMFEDYCTTWNIHGAGFKADAFNMNPDGYTVKISERGKAILEAANRVKDTIIPPLEALKQKISAAKTTRDSLQAIYDYINETGLAESISSLYEDNLSEKNMQECSEALRVYDYIIDSILTLSEIFDKENLPLGELICAIEIMFSHTDIASVPPYTEYVTIGSASTLRTENIKVAFVMGICEGEFPKTVGERSIIKKSDKEILSSLDIKLSSTQEKLSRDELYFVYRALTTPTDKLYLTCPMFSVDGRAKTPSVAFSRVLFILNKNKKELEEFDFSRIRQYIKAHADENTLPILPGEDTTDTADIHYADVDPAKAKLIFGDKIYLSKSQISTFINCPYRYWCENVLGLREAKTPNINFADIGTLVHYIIENYLKEYKNDDGTIPHKDSQFIFEKASEIAEKYISEIGFAPSPSTLYAISRFRNTAYYMLKSIDEEFMQSQFRVLATEEKINEREYSKLKPLYFDVPVSEDFKPRVVLGGTVDRIDTFCDGSDIYIRIVDYKTGADSFSIDKISDGHNVQLPIYLFAVASDINKNSPLFDDISKQDKSDKNIIPASALFLSVNEKEGQIIPFRSGFILNDENLLRAANNSLDKKFIVGSSREKTPKNHVSDEQMDEIKSILCKTVTDIAKDIYSGKAQRCPSDNACKFCKIKKQCPVAVKDKSF